MERRKAITAAAAASLTLLAGAAGIVLNSGIASGTSQNPPAAVSQVTPTTIQYINDPAPAPGATVEAAPAVTRSYEGEHERSEGHGDDD